MPVRMCMLALVVGLGLAASGCGGSSDETLPAATTTTTVETTTQEITTETTTETTTTDATPAQTITVVISGGKPQGGIQRVTVKKGDRVVLVVRSDIADEVHVHGYDVTKDVEAGRTVRIRFQATIPGRFEVELEDLGLQVADLTVEP
jgi:heme/copper-type cytochrome/quinol oxidase subunit 2